MWLKEHPDDVGLLRDTFALACVARDWRVAGDCLQRLEQAEVSALDGFAEILATARAQAGAPPR
jgi:hypothetical protein